MTWEWSHTAEAYENAYAQLCQQDSLWLLECYAEWRAWEDGKRGKFFNRNTYEYCHEVIHSEDDRALMIEGIWRRAEEARRCTNGGWELHMCPYGCHSVPVEPPEEEE